MQIFLLIRYKITNTSAVIARRYALVFAILRHASDDEKYLFCFILSSVSVVPNIIKHFPFRTIVLTYPLGHRFDVAVLLSAALLGKDCFQHFF